MPSKYAISQKAFRSAIKAKAKREKEIQRYLANVEVIVYNGLPPDLESLLEALKGHRDKAVVVRFHNWFRHQCTNYDEIMGYIECRWAIRVPADLSVEFKQRIGKRALRYLVQIRAEEVMNHPTFGHVSPQRIAQVRGGAR